MVSDAGYHMASRWLVTHGPTSARGRILARRDAGSPSPLCGVLAYLIQLEDLGGNHFLRHFRRPRTRGPDGVVERSVVGRGSVSAAIALRCRAAHVVRNAHVNSILSLTRCRAVMICNGDRLRR
jgi:hypothetical protein